MIPSTGRSSSLEGTSVATGLEQIIQRKIIH